jgi:predicted secreted protein
LRRIISDKTVDSPFSMRDRNWGEIVEAPEELVAGERVKAAGKAAGKAGGKAGGKAVKGAPSSGSIVTAELVKVKRRMQPRRLGGAPVPVPVPVPAAVPGVVEGGGAKLLTFEVQRGGKIPTMVNVVEGDTFHLRLTGNPTTGYSWSVRKPAAVSGGAGAGAAGATVEALGGGVVVEQVGDWEYKQVNCPAGAVGCGGVFDLTFLAKHAGKRSIKMDYVRPWLKNGVNPTDAADADVQVVVAAKA